MSFEKKYKDLVNLYNRGLYNEIIIQIDNLENKKNFSPELKNFKGLAYLALEDFKKATLFFKEATEQDDKFFKDDKSIIAVCLGEITIINKIGDRVIAVDIAEDDE